MSNDFHFRPPRKLGPTLIGFLIAGVVLDVLYAVESLVIGLQYPHYYDMDMPYAPGEEMLETASILLGLLMLPVFVTSVVLFCCWIYRVNKNARALGAQRMEISPGWSVGWWFIPIANLLKPYHATKEIYRASDPDRGPDDWQRAPLPATLGWWWAAWLLCGTVGNIDGRLAWNDDPQIAHLSSWTGLASGVLGVAAGLLVISIIRGINNRQLVKAAENPTARQRYCVNCDYDLAGSVGQVQCPECGQPIPQTAVEIPG